MYDYLGAKILDFVDNLNNNPTLLERLIRKEYHVSIPLLDEFNGHGERIITIYDTIKQKYGRPIAAIKKGENEGLDGVIYNHKKKVRKQLKEIIHSFAHKYNISTGNLL